MWEWNDLTILGKALAVAGMCILFASGIVIAYLIGRYL